MSLTQSTARRGGGRIVKSWCGPREEEEEEEGDSGIALVVLSEEFLAEQGKLELDCGYGDIRRGWTALNTLTSDEAAFLQSALLLLQQNLDLVEWVGCLAEAWSPEDGPAPLRGRRTLAECLTDLVSGLGMSVYLIATLNPRDCDGEKEGATGLATRGFTYTPDGNVGPVIPLHYEHWIDALDTYLHGTFGDALCAVADMAGVLLHELVHLCEGDTNPDCSCQDGPEDCCWEEQRMVASAFQWALTQRYPCLERAPRCAMDDATTFMSSCGYGGVVP